MTLGLAPATQPFHADLPGNRPADRPPSLERTMKLMNGLLRDIDGQLDDATKDASTLTMVGNLQAATATAKNSYPDDVGELTGDAKTKGIADYRARMIALLRSEIELEEALLKNDHPAARATFKALGQQRKDGHDAYGVEDHHR